MTTFLDWPNGVLEMDQRRHAQMQSVVDDLRSSSGSAKTHVGNDMNDLADSMSHELADL